MKKINSELINAVILLFMLCLLHLLSHNERNKLRACAPLHRLFSTLFDNIRVVINAN